MTLLNRSLRTLQDLPPWQKTLFILAFSQLVTSLAFSNIFPFLPFYVQSLGATTNFSLEFWIGMVYSGQAATMMIASPIWGAVADRYGRKLMVERTMFGGAIIIGMMAFARSAEELVLLRAVQGAITGVASAVNALAVAMSPRDRTGYAIGILQLSRWTGVAIGPLMGGLIADWVGYRITFIITGLLLGVAGVMVWRGVSESFTPPVKKDRPGFVAQWQVILTTPGVKLLYSIQFLNWLGRMMFVPIVPLFIQYLVPNTDRVSTLTGLTIGASSVAGTVSAVYLGKLGDRIGHRRILVVSAFLTAIFYFAQTFVIAPWQFLVLQMLGGAAAGGLIPAIGALLARNTRPGEEGAVYGLDNSIVAAARSIAPMLGSGIVIWSSLRGTFAAAGIVLFVTALLALWKLVEAPPEPVAVNL